MNEPCRERFGLDEASNSTSGVDGGAIIFGAGADCNGCVDGGEPTDECIDREEFDEWPLLGGDVRLLARARFVASIKMPLLREPTGADVFIGEMCAADDSGADVGTSFGLSSGGVKRATEVRFGLRACMVDGVEADDCGGEDCSVGDRTPRRWYDCGE